MPGLGGQERRNAIDFGAFFSWADGTTPQDLLASGIYSTIANALKGGPWRRAGLVMLGKAFATFSPPILKQRKHKSTVVIIEDGVEVAMGTVSTAAS